MKKLVLGIVLVGVVQFAFIVHTRLEAPLGSDLVSVRSELVSEERLPISTDDSQPVFPVLTEVSKTTSYAKLAPKRPAIAQHRARPLSSRPAKDGFDGAVKSRKHNMEPVVITYNTDQRIDERESTDGSPSQKRSFVAKAAPVIKKPWEWMKALGSKLY
jgi:hypothetical protein